MAVALMEYNMDLGKNSGGIFCYSPAAAVLSPFLYSFSILYHIKAIAMSNFSVLLLF